MYLKMDWVTFVCSEYERSRLVKHDDEGFEYCDPRPLDDDILSGFPFNWHNGRCRQTVASSEAGIFVQLNNGSYQTPLSISFSGRGCDLFLNGTWNIRQRSHHVSRLDLCTDVIVKKTDWLRCVKAAQDRVFEQDLEKIEQGIDPERAFFQKRVSFDGSGVSSTLYIGTRGSSPVFFRVYNKTIESGGEYKPVDFEKGGFSDVPEDCYVIRYEAEIKRRKSGDGQSTDPTVLYDSYLSEDPTECIDFFVKKLLRQLHPSMVLFDPSEINSVCVSRITPSDDDPDGGPGSGKKTEQKSYFVQFIGGPEDSSSVPEVFTFFEYSKAHRSNQDWWFEQNKRRMAAALLDPQKVHELEEINSQDLGVPYTIDVYRPYQGYDGCSDHELYMAFEAPREDLIVEQLRL